MTEIASVRFVIDETGSHAPPVAPAPAPGPISAVSPRTVPAQPATRSQPGGAGFSGGGGDRPASWITLNAGEPNEKRIGLLSPEIKRTQTTFGSAREERARNAVQESTDRMADSARKLSDAIPSFEGGATAIRRAADKLEATLHGPPTSPREREAARQPPGGAEGGGHPHNAPPQHQPHEGVRLPNIFEPAQPPDLPDGDGPVPAVVVNETRDALVNFAHTAAGAVATVIAATGAIVGLGAGVRAVIHTVEAWRARLEETTRELAPFSAELTRIANMQMSDAFRLNVERARLSGPDLSALAEQQSKLDQPMNRLAAKIDNIEARILIPMLRAMTAAANIADKGSDAVVQLKTLIDEKFPGHLELSVFSLTGTIGLAMYLLADWLGRQPDAELSVFDDWNKLFHTVPDLDVGQFGEGKDLHEAPGFNAGFNRPPGQAGDRLGGRGAP